MLRLIRWSFAILVAFSVFFTPKFFRRSLRSIIWMSNFLRWHSKERYTMCITMCITHLGKLERCNCEIQLRDASTPIGRWAPVDDCWIQLIGSEGSCGWTVRIRNDHSWWLSRAIKRLKTENDESKRWTQKRQPSWLNQRMEPKDESNRWIGSMKSMIRWPQRDEPTTGWEFLEARLGTRLKSTNWKRNKSAESSKQERHKSIAK